MQVPNTPAVSWAGRVGPGVRRAGGSPDFKERDKKGCPGRAPPQPALLSSLLSHPHPFPSPALSPTQPRHPELGRHGRGGGGPAGPATGAGVAPGAREGGREGKGVRGVAASGPRTSHPRAHLPHTHPHPHTHSARTSWSWWRRWRSGSRGRCRRGPKWSCGWRSRSRRHEVERDGWMEGRMKKDGCAAVGGEMMSEVFCWRTYGVCPRHVCTRVCIPTCECAVARLYKTGRAHGTQKSASRHPIIHLSPPPPPSLSPPPPFIPRRRCSPP